MEVQDLLQWIMIALLLVGSYLGVLHFLAKQAVAQQAFPVVAGLLLVIFGVAAATLVYASHLIGTEFVLLALLLLITLLTICSAVLYLIRNFRELNLGMMTLLLVYLLALAYVTVLSRGTAGDHSVSLFRTDLVQSTLRSHSLEPVKHIILNMALFTPLGFLLPHIDPETLDDPLYPLLLSLSLTVLIESTQMMLHLGQADLTDIVANVLGGVLGSLLYRLFRRLGFSAEDEDD